MTIDETHRRKLLNTIDADSLWLFLKASLEAGSGASVVRMGDGERAIMELARTGETRPFLAREEWLREYGLLGMDLDLAAESLRQAQDRATWIAPSPTGAINQAFDLLPHLRQRDRWAPCYYASHWVPCGRHADLLEGQRVALCARQAEDLAARLQANTGAAEVVAVPIDSWRDHHGAHKAIRAACPRIVILSAGPPGKLLTVELGEDGHIALDIGSRLGLWVRT